MVSDPFTLNEIRVKVNISSKLTIMSYNQTVIILTGAGWHWFAVHQKDIFVSLALFFRGGERGG